MPPVIAPGHSRCVGTVFGVSTRNAPRYMPMFTSAATTSASTARMAAFCPYVLRPASSVVTITPAPSRLMNSTARPSRGTNPGLAGPGRFQTCDIVNRPPWDSPVEPQISPAIPTISPITLCRLSSCTFSVSWLPIAGTCLATVFSTSARKAGFTAATRPRAVTRISSSGNNDTNAEYARFETSTPPLSSPYFLMTPYTNAVGVNRRCVWSTARIARSTGFIGVHPLLPALFGCPLPGRPNNTGGSPGSDRVRLVANVGDEHVPGGVGDRERGPRAGERHLRGDAAGPENRHVPVPAVHPVAKIRPGHIGDAECLRAADV